MGCAESSCFAVSVREQNNGKMWRWKQRSGMEKKRGEGLRGAPERKHNPCLAQLTPEGENYNGS
jgi:hypothetical protein